MRPAPPLTRLQHTLWLAENQLESLPVAIFGLPALRRLDVAYNRLTSLPAVDCMPPLVELIAHHNLLAELPDYVLECRALLCLSMDWNPIEDKDYAETIRKDGALALVKQKRRAARSRAVSAASSQQVGWQWRRRFHNMRWLVVAARLATRLAQNGTTRRAGERPVESIARSSDFAARS